MALLHQPHMDGYQILTEHQRFSGAIRHVAEAVCNAITRSVTSLPETLGQCLTWDRGAEMTQHELPRVDTGLQTFSISKLLTYDGAKRVRHPSKCRATLSGLSSPRHYDVPRGVLRAIIDAIVEALCSFWELARFMLLFERWQQPSALGMETTMNPDMSSYSVTELASEEASATSGGMFWAVAFAIFGILGLAAVSIGAKAADRNH
ncbi:hypothetical protein [Rhizobium mongolense]|uniref:Integrase catalytic domain-containing protein n=1 Tax=Rhizobium mongolense TaxID=57676 RepID=A0ABR6IZM3_9HYPH|nr:hypothetical protein [Rhizobium mongolense]MBB4233376.1 hypothetical protein [Rhizobium mongolense]